MTFAEMRPYICTLILFVVSALVIALDEMLASTWMPMFLMQIASVAIALHIAHISFLILSGRLKSRAILMLLSSGTVFLYVAGWIFLWELSEEGLLNFCIDHRIDTEGGYFYPGHSGMGYARGLSSPTELFSKILPLGLICGFVGSQFGFILKLRDDN